MENGRKADGNTQNGFEIARINPVAGVPGILSFAGVDGTPEHLFRTDTNNIAARSAFAWRPFGGEKTVIRGGIGLFYGNPGNPASPAAPGDWFWSGLTSRAWVANPGTARGGIRMHADKKTYRLKSRRPARERAAVPLPPASGAVQYR